MFSSRAAVFLSNVKLYFFFCLERKNIKYMQRLNFITPFQIFNSLKRIFETIIFLFIFSVSLSIPLPLKEDIEYDVLCSRFFPGYLIRSVL